MFNELSLFVLEARLPFSINFLLNFNGFFKIFTLMNIRNGSFLN